MNPLSQDSQEHEDKNSVQIPGILWVEEESVSVVVKDLESILNESQYEELLEKVESEDQEINVEGLQTILSEQEYNQLTEMDRFEEVVNVHDPEETVKFNQQQENLRYCMYIGNNGLYIFDLEDLPTRRYQNMKENAEEKEHYYFKEFTAMELFEALGGVLDMELDVKSLTDEEKEQLEQLRQQMAQKQQMG